MPVARFASQPWRGKVKITDLLPGDRRKLPEIMGPDLTYVMQTEHPDVPGARLVLWFRSGEPLLAAEDPDFVVELDDPHRSPEERQKALSAELVNHSWWKSESGHCCNHHRSH